jgi:hypothetical protein
VGQPHQAGRARGALADSDHPAVPGIGEGLLVEHLDL